MNKHPCPIYLCVTDGELAPLADAVKQVAQFYGVIVEPLCLREMIAETQRPQALIVSGKNLRGAAEQRALKHWLEQWRDLPCLFIDLPEAQLQALSDGLIAGSVQHPSGFVGNYRCGSERSRLHALSGLALPVQFKKLRYFQLEEGENACLLSAEEPVSEAAALPVLVELRDAEKPWFFLASAECKGLPDEPFTRLDAAHLPYTLPLLIFLRHACAERAWHAPGLFANLTIDDPWLTQAYGHFDYARILAAMEQANYHTTIAFVPWNYDRSEKKIVELVKQHPDRFSFCVHGNNHDHREFYRYQTSADDPLPAKPLAEHEANIRQGLARMESFTTLTGLDYDRVMVFPHAIAPEPTLALLKKYQFLATSNSGHVPLDAAPPSDDPLFDWQSFTLNYANFLSLNRYPPEPDPYCPQGRTEADQRLDLFLGNPLLFFVHHEFYAAGPDAFNRYAETVNRAAPGLRWTGLGEIARHLYRQRQLEETQYEVRLFSREARLHNPSAIERRYYVCKTESFQPPVRAVTLDGAPLAFHREGDVLHCELSLPAATSALLVIHYADSFSVAEESPDKTNWRIRRLRYLSDARDLFIYTHPRGQAFIDAYYAERSSGMKRASRLLGLGLLLSLGAVGFLLRHIVRRR